MQQIHILAAGNVQAGPGRSLRAARYATLRYIAHVCFPFEWLFLLLVINDTNMNPVFFQAKLEFLQGLVLQRLELGGCAHCRYTDADKATGKR
jgi:hypothetical protein